MRKKKCLCALVVTVALSLLPTVVYGATGWVENGDAWYYYNEDGSVLKNTFAPDGYYVDHRGKCVPLDTSGDWRNKEYSANMFFLYLETGDPKYLLGSDGIEPGKETGVVNFITGKRYLSWVDYQSCLGGHLFPTKRSGLMSISGLFEPGKIYPDRESVKESLELKAKFDPRKVTDEYQVPIYFNYMRSLNDYGDFKLYTGAKNAGLTIHEVLSQNPEQYSDAEKANLITQRDMYRVVHSFISEGLAGTESMSQKQLAEHLEIYLDEKLEYSYTKMENKENEAGYSPVYSILSGSGVCADYAGLYRILADAAGIPCWTETGKTKEGIPHAWNVISIDGINYHVDATWADTDPQYKGLMTSCHINGETCGYK